MFYQENMDKTLRFGDVLRGYVSINSSIKGPLPHSKDEEYNYKIDIELPTYSVVLTPCCSIEEGTICLTPLIKVRVDFFKNPYFSKDLTIINRKMTAEQSVRPEIWDKFSLEEKQRRLKEGMEYALPQFFIYSEHEIFRKYAIRDKETRYYMIDFKNVSKIKCELIKKYEKIKPMAPIVDPILESKILQLSRGARKDLREKLSSYYWRIPEEDKILEE